VLADEFVLYAKSRGVHCNVEGIDFYNKHLLFEKQYEELDEIMDAVAERIRVLGHYASAKLSEYLQLTHLTQDSREPNNSEAFIRKLLEDYEAVIIHLREKINYFNDELNDAGTVDFITGLMEKHETMA
jgi:starvation-inducible DNA-binding protein